MSAATLSPAERERRVRAVLAAARVLADASSPLGKEARLRLPSETGLSPQGVELGLSRHLETDASAADVASLLARTHGASRVHVVLSANVFVGVVRAVALAVAAAPLVFVRASRRESVMPELLQRALASDAGGRVFDLVSAIRPVPADEVHVYGRRQTIAAISSEVPAHVRVRGHGPGFGIAVIEASSADLARAAQGLSWDIVAFDQRGCLSPRVAIVHGTAKESDFFARALAEELTLREREVPRGTPSEDERSELALYRQTARALGGCVETPFFTVSHENAQQNFILPPAGRHIHVARVSGSDDFARLLRPFAGAITTVGSAGRGEVVSSWLAKSKGVRHAHLGEMQRPPLDGPVDLREML